ARSTASHAFFSPTPRLHPLLAEKPVPADNIVGRIVPGASRLAVFRAFVSTLRHGHPLGPSDQCRAYSLFGWKNFDTLWHHEGIDTIEIGWPVTSKESSMLKRIVAWSVLVLMPLTFAAT